MSAGMVNLLLRVGSGILLAMFLCRQDFCYEHMTAFCSFVLAISTEMRV